MSRSVAGFVMLLYVCVVSGQLYPRIRLKGTGDEPSIAIDHISGGNYPAGSFSIGYGDNNQNDDGGPGQDFGVNSGSGQIYPNSGGSQNGGGYVNGQNDIIGGYGGQNGPAQNGGVNEFGVPIQNNIPGQRPAGPYDHNQQNSNKNVPVRNSATRNSFFSSLWNFIVGWF